MPKFNLGWLKDKNGEKFAPKTFTKQVISKTGENLENILEEKITTPLLAEVGQQLTVKEVDENGKPIEWECKEYNTEKYNIATELEVISGLIDLGVVNPFTNNDNTVFIDNNDNIYVL